MAHLTIFLGILVCGGTLVGKHCPVEHKIWYNQILTESFRVFRGEPGFQSEVDGKENSKKYRRFYVIRLCHLDIRLCLQNIIIEQRSWNEVSNSGSFGSLQNVIILTFSFLVFNTFVSFYLSFSLFCIMIFYFLE